MATLLYSKRMLRYTGARGARSRQKTFRTEDKAKNYAALKGIKGCSVVQRGKKFIIKED